MSSIKFHSLCATLCTKKNLLQNLHVKNYKASFTQCFIFIFEIVFIAYWIENRAATYANIPNISKDAVGRAVEALIPILAPIIFC